MDNAFLQQLQLPQEGGEQQDITMMLDQHIQDIIALQLTDEQKIYIIRNIL